MKKIFLFGVMIFSLLAICNCKNDLSTGNVNKRGEAGENETQGVETQGVEEDKGETQDDETPEVVSPEMAPPEIENPIVNPPETVQPIIKPPEVITTVIEPPVVEPQEVKQPEAETPEIETQEVETPENETQGDEAEKCLLQINELRTEFTSLVNHAEYIEFKVIKGGGMDGLFFYSVMNNAQDIFVYIFPKITVEAGEYITLHLRTMEKNNCCDELDDDLTVSGGTDSCPSARDLWVTGSDKLIDKTCFIYIQDINGKIMDAVFLNEKPAGAWNNSQTHFAEIAEKLCNEGMWKSAGTKPAPLDAVNTQAVGTSPYKSVSRYEGRENTHSAKDWYITGYITPGLPNK